MSRKWNNIFFGFGLAALILMAAGIDMDEARDALRSASYRFPLIVMLWALLYILNTAAWYLIINAGGRSGIKFGWLYKVTVSGFALNYATPGGLMGGEPYRIMALAPRIGTERASSSVILYAMTHIFSHFWFWLLSCLLYVATQPMNAFMAVLLSVIATLCTLAIWFFIKGYKKGIAVRCMNMLSHFPGLKRRVQGFIERHEGQLATIDSQIAALHNQNPRAFVSAVTLELACRVASALEIYFILLVIMPSADYLECILILAFTSLLANLLFFMPLQLGGLIGLIAQNERQPDVNASCLFQKVND